MTAYAGTGQPGIRPEEAHARTGLPNAFADPLRFSVFLLVIVPWRMARSLQRTLLWVCGFSIENKNHASVNYAQVQRCWHKLLNYLPVRITCALSLVFASCSSLYLVITHLAGVLVSDPLLTGDVRALPVLRAGASY